MAARPPAATAAGRARHRDRLKDKEPGDAVDEGSRAKHREPVDAVDESSRAKHREPLGGGRQRRGRHAFDAGRRF